MNKEQKQSAIFLGILIFMTGFAICMVANLIRSRLTVYEYYKDNEFGISPRCYVNDKDQCMCLIDNQFQYVDSYYKK